MCRTYSGITLHFILMYLRCVWLNEGQNASLGQRYCSTRGQPKERTFKMRGWSREVHFALMMTTWLRFKPLVSRARLLLSLQNSRMLWKACLSCEVSRLRRYMAELHWEIVSCSLIQPLIAYESKQHHVQRVLGDETDSPYGSLLDTLVPTSG